MGSGGRRSPALRACASCCCELTAGSLAARNAKPLRQVSGSRGGYHVTVLHTHPGIRACARPSECVCRSDQRIPMAATRGTELDSNQATTAPQVDDEPTPVEDSVGGTDGRGHRGRPGPFARLGGWAATHFRRVLIAWVLVLLVFGIFAVHVENALAGAGWQASNSQSVAARAVIEKDFAGLGATGLQVVIVDP